jgi:hypothetical protein
VIIYLDQNKWIELAKMAHGKDKSDRAKNVLSDFEAAIEDENISIPLSEFHYIETSRISNVGRKIRLGEIMWRFSKGRTIVGYSAVVRHELEVAFSKHFPQISASRLVVLGRGFGHAFGLPPLQGLLQRFEERVERSMLVGDDVLGIAPISSHISTHRINFHEYLASLNERHKAVPKIHQENWLYATSVIDVLDPINDVLSKHKLPKGLLSNLGSEKLKQIVNDMPTRRVDLHLHRQVLRNPQYRSRITDLEDWGSLALASSYCDVVVCEKHMADMLRRDGFTTHARIEVDIEKTFSLFRRE